jgi:hypothetical protein
MMTQVDVGMNLVATLGAAETHRGEQPRSTGSGSGTKLTRSRTNSLSLLSHSSASFAVDKHQARVQEQPRRAITCRRLLPSYTMRQTLSSAVMQASLSDQPPMVSTRAFISDVLNGTVKGVSSASCAT